MKTLQRLRFEAEEYWRSERSTVHGMWLAVVGLASSTSGSHALQALGIPEHFVQIVAAIAVIGGAILVTPREKTS